MILKQRLKNLKEIYITGPSRPVPPQEPQEPTGEDHNFEAGKIMGELDIGWDPDKGPIVLHDD